MTFLVPDDGNPLYQDTEYQSRPFESDWTILGASIGGTNGGVSGCAVTESSVPAMTVDVAAGTVVILSGSVAVAGEADVLLSNSDPTDPRFDLIVAVSDGSVQVLEGIASSAPKCPVPASGEVALAQVFVGAGAVSITDACIVDKRVSVNIPLLQLETWQTVSATTDLARNNTATMTADPVLKFPMAANKVYRIRGQLWFRGGTGWTPGFVKLGVGGPASPTSLAGYFRTVYGGSGIPPSFFGAVSTSYEVAFTIYNTTTGMPSPYNSISGPSYTAWEEFEAVVSNGANAGDFAIWWAMITAQAHDLSRLAGSYIEYWEL